MNIFQLSAPKYFQGGDFSDLDPFLGIILALNYS